MTPLCFLDTETTGVHPDRKVWEVAMIRRDDSGQREIQFFVDVDLAKADPFGLKVGGFYDRHPVGQFQAGLRDSYPKIGTWVDGSLVDAELVYDDEAADRISRWTHGAHIVGAVPNFDTEVLDKLLRQQEHLPAWHYHLVDVENLAVGYLSGMGVTVAPPWKSDALGEALGVEPAKPEERHTALGDAKWAMRIYDHIMLGVSR